MHLCALYTKLIAEFFFLVGLAAKPAVLRQIQTRLVVCEILSSQENFILSSVILNASQI